MVLSFLVLGCQLKNHSGCRNETEHECGGEGRQVTEG
jgi:hypothetical protein